MCVGGAYLLFPYVFSLGAYEGFMIDIKDSWAVSLRINEDFMMDITELFKLLEICSSRILQEQSPCYM